MTMRYSVGICVRSVFVNLSTLLQGIAIFSLMFTYYLWIKSVKTGSIYWAAICALAYFYMVSKNVCTSRSSIYGREGCPARKVMVSYFLRDCVVTSSRSQTPDINIGTYFYVT